MYQNRQASPVVLSGRKCGRALLDPLANRLLEPTNASESGLDHSLAIVGHEDQMDVSAFVERADELPHAVAGVGLWHLDVSDVPARPPQQERFRKLRQVVCRLIQPQVSCRRSLLNRKTPDRHADRGRECDRCTSFEP